MRREERGALHPTQQKEPEAVTRSSDDFVGCHYQLPESVSELRCLKDSAALYPRLSLKVTSGDAYRRQARQRCLFMCLGLCSPADR